MEDSLYAKAKVTAIGVGKLLSDHKGGNSLVMDLSRLNAWTDFFVIATVSSSTHLQGLQKHIKEYAAEHSVDILRRQRKTPSDEEWSLIDLGNVVVHLMTAKARAFYDLERLWSDADFVWRSES
jgi:ribosome-associated protein